MPRRRRRNRSLLAIAGRGAVAGLIGGVALAATDRLLTPRLAGGTPRSRAWDRQVAAAGESVGLRLPARQRELAGVATSLVYAALLGAAYAVARDRLSGLGAASGLLDDALAYGAALVVPARRRPLRGAKMASLGGRAAARADDPELFRRVTTTALRFLA